MSNNILEQVEDAFNQDMEEVETQVLEQWKKHLKEHPVIQQNKLFHFGGEGSGNFGHEGRPGMVGGSGEGKGESMSLIGKLGKIDESTFPPSVVLDRNVKLYHASGRNLASGLDPIVPIEILEETDDEDEQLELRGVYLAERQRAERYLRGRLGGSGKVYEVELMAGTRVYQDPIDYGAVFVKGGIGMDRIREAK